MLHEQMTKIITYSNGAEIYISGVESLIYGENDLFENNIYTVLSFLDEYHKPEYLTNLPTWIRHYYTSIKDNPNENITKYFQSSYKVIKDTLDLGRSVLIHCRAGISRSATILVAFFLRALFFEPRYACVHSKSLPTWTDTIIEYIRLFRDVRPNSGFYNQLLQYERKLSFNKEFQRQACNLSLIQ